MKIEKVDGMKLWLISRPDGADYDQYDSAIVAAKTEDEARLIHPSTLRSDWDGTDENDSWLDAKRVIVELIGTAKKGTKKGVICASFNAG